MEILQELSTVTGIEINHVVDDNRPGDIFIEMSESTIAGINAAIIVEIKDDKESRRRKRVSIALNEARADRDTDAAIFLGRTSADLAKELGEWGKGQLERGTFVELQTGPCYD